MKKIFYSLLMLCMTVSSLSSCMDDGSDTSNNYTATTDEIKTLYRSALAGMYTGRAYYYDPATVSKTDSTDQLTWQVTSSDSTIIFYNFPISILGSYLTANNETEAGALVSSLKNRNISMHYYIPSYTYTTYLTNKIYTVSAIPDNSQIEFTENDKTYIIKFSSSWSDTYVSSTYYSYATAYNGAYQQMIIISSISIDGTTYTISKPFVAQSKS